MGTIVAQNCIGSHSSNIALGVEVKGALLIVLIVIHGSTAAGLFRKEESANGPRVTLEQAIERAIVYSPRLVTRASLVDASNGNLNQTGLFPNTQFSVEVENFLGSNRYNGFQNSEITYSINQTFEFPAKTHLRKQAARFAVDRSQQELEIERLNVIRDVRVAYANAILAKEKKNLTSEHRKLSKRLLVEVEKRIRAGRESALYKINTETDAAKTKLSFEKAWREERHAIHVLSSLWGGHEQDLSLDHRSSSLDSPPSESVLETALLEGPDMKRWQIEKQRQDSIYKMEKVSAAPDLHVLVGLRHLIGTSDFAAVAGFSLPIPLFNRNQGNIERARAEVSAAEGNVYSETAKLRNEVFEQLETNINAYEEANSIRETILPAAEKVFQGFLEGYSMGRFPYLEVLDAKRKLFELKERYVTVMNDYSLARAELERLVGKNLFVESVQENAHAK